MTSILALDCSKYVGWSFFASPDANPKCRTWVAPGSWGSEEYAPYYLAFKKWLGEMLDVLQPDILAFESPIVASFGAGRGNDQNNMRRLIGVVAVAELMALERGIDCHEVDNQVAKSFVGVSGRRPKDMPVGEYKSQMVVAMTERGFSVADTHQADSCAIALVVMEDLGLT